MKGLTKAGIGALVLGLTVVVLLLLLGSLAGAGGQPADRVPTPTPQPATGGPYISEQQAIATALRFARLPGNQLDETIPPRAIFTAAKNIYSILGDPRPAGTSERKKWIVIFKGRFHPLKAPPPPPPGYRRLPQVFQKMYVVIDATTGQWHLVHVAEELEPGGLVRE
jgi:hypothetical protein